MSTATLDRIPVGYSHPEVPWNGLTGVSGARENENGPESATNTLRSLTHSLDETKEGLRWSLPASSDLATGRTRRLTARAAESSSRPRRLLFALAALHGAAPVTPAALYAAASSTISEKQSAARASGATRVTFAARPRLSLALVSSSFSRSTTTTKRAHGEACSASAATKRSVCSATTLSGCNLLRNTFSTHRASNSLRSRAVSA